MLGTTIHIAKGSATLGQGQGDEQREIVEGQRKQMAGFGMKM